MLFFDVHVVVKWKWIKKKGAKVGALLLLNSQNWLLGGIQSEYLDIFNVTSNSWASYPEGLGQARSSLAAASLPSGLVFFAGGLTGATKRMFALQLRHVHFCESLYVLA